MRRIFGLKRNEVTGKCRILRIVELNDLYTSPSIDRVIKSRRMRWAGQVTRMGERRGIYRVLVGKLKERDNLEDPGVDGRIIIRCGMWDMNWIDLTQDRDKWWALVNEIMNLRGRKMGGIS